MRLEQVIADAFSVLETGITAVGAQVSLPETNTQVTVDQAEIQEVIVNRSPFAQSISNIPNFKLSVERSTQPLPLQEFLLQP